MRRVVLVLIGLLSPLSAAFAQAHPLQGTWVVRSPLVPNYVANVLIDNEGRATYDSPRDNGRPAKFIGYIARMDGSRVQFRLTDRAVVIHLNCSAESAELLTCQVIFQKDGATGKTVALVRVGPGPHRL